MPPFPRLIARDVSPPLRILIVEDSFLSSQHLARMLEELGAKILGPAPSVAAAMQMLDAAMCDGAVLDINLGPETSEAIALRLETEGIPFFFVSGYASPRQFFFRLRFGDHRLIGKPVEPATLREAVKTLFANRQIASHALCSKRGAVGEVLQSGPLIVQPLLSPAEVRDSQCPNRPS
jgi:DNA-binding NarL/FixJ family response regulator